MGEEKAKITISLSKDGIKFKLENTMKYVELTRDDAEEYLCKAFYMSLNTIYNLVDISPYMYFLILKTPDWARTYISRLAICRLVGTTYEEFVQGKFPSGALSDNVFLCLPNERGNFLVAQWLIEQTELLTKDPKKQKEFVESILFRYGAMRKKSLEFQSYGADELIAMVILDRELPKKKIDDKRSEDDEELFCAAFEHLKEKKVIEKFFKGKERQLPETKEGFADLNGWDKMIPSKLVSYINTTTFRVNSFRYKTDPKKGNSLGDILKDNSSFDDIYNLLENRLLREQLNLLAEETLTEREKQVVDLKYRENLTQEEIARRLKISQEMISKHHSKALRTLRKNLKFILPSNR